MNRIQTVIVTALLAGAVPLAVQGNILNHRINELETYYTIYASRFENWSNRALQDEQIIENLQQVNTTAQQQPAPESDLPAGMVAEYAGEYTCTAYCTEKRPHICGTGTGITASGAPITADLTVAADQSLLPFGTVIYIEASASASYRTKALAYRPPPRRGRIWQPRRRAALGRLRNAQGLGFERGVNPWYMESESALQQRRSTCPNPWPQWPNVQSRMALNFTIPGTSPRIFLSWSCAGTTSASKPKCPLNTYKSTSRTVA